ETRSIMTMRNYGTSSYTTSNKSEKLVCSSAVKLLVRLRLRRREAHDCHELGEELGTEMPPCVPEEIFRRRCPTRDWRAFQIRMEFVDDDQRFRSFCALLNDPKRIAAME